MVSMETSSESGSPENAGPEEPAAAGREDAAAAAGRAEPAAPSHEDRATARREDAAAAGHEEPSENLVLRLEGFEGPMDLLLDLARSQKVDLAKISILSLVDQYLAVIEGARRVRLELAADWLVMAAWLTWLKSRLLVPTAPDDDLESGEEAAEALAARLREMNVIRTLAGWLAARPVLGQEVFARGAPESHYEFDWSRILIEPGPFVRGYLEAIRRGTKSSPYTPRALTFWTVQDALRRLADLLGSLPDWTTLEQFLPDHLDSPTERRAALSSTLLAGLEMARGGAVRLRQDEAFGPILVRRGAGDVEHG
jgi:segregation and condensation protein A